MLKGDWELSGDTYYAHAYDLWPCLRDCRRWHGIRSETLSCSFVTNLHRKRTNQTTFHFLNFHFLRIQIKGHIFFYFFYISIFRTPSPFSNVNYKVFLCDKASKPVLPEDDVQCVWKWVRAHVIFFFPQNYDFNMRIMTFFLSILASNSNF